jgi:hypothetical protein
MWTALVSLAAVLIAVVAIFAIVSPTRFLDQFDAFDLPSKVWMLAGIRFVMGMSFWLAAPESGHPTVFRVFGVITVAAAVALPIMGASGISRLLDWWRRRPPAVIRAWGAIATGFALFLIWSLYST